MPCTLVLYGATGYSGRLIAVELGNLCEAKPKAYRVVLAGRDAEHLQELAGRLKLDYSVFDLEDELRIPRALADLDAKVVINAAGPFADTAKVLARGAIEAHCHYVDINGEADVYRDLDDLAGKARANEVALVASAGFWAAASNLLLDTALQALDGDKDIAPYELGAVRIGMSRIRTFSRGSATTVWRSLRKHVTVVRRGKTEEDPVNDTLVLRREPVGRLERNFNFGSARKPDRRIASAASLVDTLAARWILLKRQPPVGTIESYVEAGLAARVTYQVGAWLAPLVAVPRVRMLAQQPAEMLPAGPTRSERGDERHVIVLEIEDSFRNVLIDWRWQTPNVYQFTAHLVAKIAEQLAIGPALKGWVTPAEVLRPLHLPLTAQEGPLRGCTLEQRRG